MKIYTLASFLVLASLNQTLLAKESENDSGVFLQLRYGYTATKNNTNSRVSSNAVGGSLAYLSPTKKGLSTGGKIYSTNSIGNATDGKFLGSDGNGYSIVGEAWVQAYFAKTAIKIGRQSVDTPFASVDDRGMISNTFQGIVVRNTSLANTTFVTAHLDKWAGIDSNSPETFTDMNGKNGVQVVGGIYEMDTWNTQLWHYIQKNSTDMTYADISITPVEYLDFGFQYITQKDSAVGGTANTFGATMTYTVGDFSVDFDYNKVSGSNAVINGFGGGPYFTSTENNTIDGIKNANANGIGIEYSGINKLTLGIRTVDFDQGLDNELDITASYHLRNDVTADFFYSDMGTEGQNVRLFMNYNFNW